MGRIVDGSVRAYGMMPEEIAGVLLKLLEKKKPLLFDDKGGLQRREGKGSSFW
jgi:hypothetical protein